MDARAALILTAALLVACGGSARETPTPAASPTAAPAPVASTAAPTVIVATPFTAATAAATSSPTPEPTDTPAPTATPTATPIAVATATPAPTATVAPRLQLIPESVPVRGSLDVRGSGFTPNSPASATGRAGLISLRVASFTTDAHGGFSASLQLPAAVPAGSYTITVTDERGVSASAGLTVTP